ncbi:hypothetical protein [Streptomyces sp. NPDC005345]
MLHCRAKDQTDLPNWKRKHSRSRKVGAKHTFPCAEGWKILWGIA